VLPANVTLDAVKKACKLELPDLIIYRSALGAYGVGIDGVMVGSRSGDSIVRSQTTYE